MSARIAVLGSTGSIGRQTLDVVAGLGPDWRVVAIAAHSNAALLAGQARRFGCRYASVQDSDAYGVLKESLVPRCEAGLGEEELVRLATLPDVDIVVVAVVGTAGILPTIRALESGKRVALANKETLVAAGRIVLDAAERGGGTIIPVDSEHSAIFQCLQGQPEGALDRITLTASGGPFRDMARDELEHVTVGMALRHPSWNMGAKVTLDSATLMNKGLEVIEAHWLFGLDYDHIDVLIHPPSIVHSMIHLIDGSMLAQLGPPDMRLPIQYALTYPGRLTNTFSRLDLAKAGGLTFSHPDLDRFPSLRLAYEAGQAGGTMPAVLNAANEVAVDAFRSGKIRFTAIPRIVEDAMGKHSNSPASSLAAIANADTDARKAAQCFIRDLEG